MRDPDNKQAPWNPDWIAKPSTPAKQILFVWTYETYQKRVKTSFVFFSFKIFFCLFL